MIDINESFILDIAELACLKIDNLEPFEVKESNLLDMLQMAAMVEYTRRLF